MSSPTFESGDVFWAPDLYRTGGNPRPWLVHTAENSHYPGEDYICAALTLSDLPDNVEVRAEDWVAGNDSDKRSYCLPWVRATVKHDAVAGDQGYLTDEFIRDIVQRSVAYLAADI